MTPAQEYRRHVFTLETLVHLEALRSHAIAHEALVAAMLFFQKEEREKFPTEEQED